MYVLVFVVEKTETILDVITKLVNYFLRRPSFAWQTAYTHFGQVSTGDGGKVKRRQVLFLKETNLVLQYHLRIVTAGRLATLVTVIVYHSVGLCVTVERHVCQSYDNRWGYQNNVVTRILEIQNLLSHRRYEMKIKF